MWPERSSRTKRLTNKNVKGRCVNKVGIQVWHDVRILEQQDAIRAVLAQDHKELHLVSSWQDIDVLQSVFAAIKPFQKITDLLSGEKRVTCSAIKPMIQLIQETMVNHQDNDTALTCEIKRLHQEWSRASLCWFSSQHALGQMLFPSSKI